MVLVKLRTSPENTHLPCSFVEIPLKSSSIVKMNDANNRRESLPYSLTVGIWASSKLEHSDRLNPNSLTLEAARPLQSLTNR
jgi:hypothetical protein